VAKSGAKRGSSQILELPQTLMTRIYIAISIGALMLTCLAKLVEASGRAHILTVNYAEIEFPEKINRWAANCLYRAACASGLPALASFAMPSYSGLFLTLFLTSVVGTALAISLGARRFRRA
jgi:hypothetical protein